MLKITLTGILSDAMSSDIIEQAKEELDNYDRGMGTVGVVGCRLNESTKFRNLALKHGAMEQNYGVVAVLVLGMLCAYSKDAQELRYRLAHLDVLISDQEAETLRV